MSRREVQFLWVGLVSGFLFGVVATVLGIALIFGVPHPVTEVAVHTVPRVAPIRMSEG